jgi:hypothetical protein
VVLLVDPGIGGYWGNNGVYRYIAGRVGLAYSSRGHEDGEKMRKVYLRRALAVLVILAFAGCGKSEPKADPYTETEYSSKYRLTWWYLPKPCNGDILSRPGYPLDASRKEFNTSVEAFEYAKKELNDSACEELAYIEIVQVHYKQIVHPKVEQDDGK